MKRILIFIAMLLFVTMLFFGAIYQFKPVLYFIMGAGCVGLIYVMWQLAGDFIDQV